MNLKNIAVIPARHGSKRIPNKNLKEFNGVPVISYAIKNAIESQLFQDVVVSTDSENIADVARNFGASVNSLRPDYLADDFTTTADVIKYEVNQYIEKNGKADFVCCIYPATPLLKINRIIEGFEKIKQSNWNYVISCQEYASSPERFFKLGLNESIEIIKLEIMKQRTQDLPQYFHDAGQFYWGKSESWLNQDPIFAMTSTIIKMRPFEVVDIDTIEDWHYAELLSKIGENQR